MLLIWQQWLEWTCGDYPEEEGYCEEVEPTDEELVGVGVFTSNIDPIRKPWDYEDEVRVWNRMCPFKERTPKGARFSHTERRRGRCTAERVRLALLAGVA